MIFFPLRDENPLRIRPWATYALIVVNVAVFLWQTHRHLSGDVWLEQVYGLVPARFMADPGPESVTIFSSMFMHGGWFHLASNLWFLRVFGDNLEETYGRLRYLLFYFACGIAAAAAQVAMNRASEVPMVGASGAIAGVVGGYLVLYPQAAILSLNTVPLLWLFFGVFVVVPAWLIGGMFFITNLFSAVLTFASLGEVGIAFFAHIGGFVAGFSLTATLVDRRRLTAVKNKRRHPPP